MWGKFLTALMCLVALLAEVTLDSSTSFVRVNAAPVVGKLVITKSKVEKKLNLAGFPDAAADTSNNASDNGSTDDDSSDLKEFSMASHAGNIVAPVVLSLLQPVSRLVIYTDPPYHSLIPASLLRPPAA